MVGLRTYSEPGQLFKNRPGPARTFALFYPLFYTSLTFGPRPSSPNLDSFHLYYQHVTWDRILTDRHETGRFKTACMVFIETGMITTTTATEPETWRLSGSSLLCRSIKETLDLLVTDDVIKP